MCEQFWTTIAENGGGDLDFTKQLNPTAINLVRHTVLF